jgi:sporulation protein YlmC with PRC-barrel domain
MLTKPRLQLSRLGLGWIMIVAFFFSFSFTALADEVKNKKIEKPAEKIDLQEVFRASDIIDQTIRNGQGQDLGEVDDLIMSRNGKIKKVILSVGGFLGVGDRLVAVSFKSLRMGKKGEIVYDVSRQQLEHHPIFSYRKERLYEYYYAPPPPYGPYGPLGIPQRRYKGYYPYGRPYGPYPPPGKYGGEYGPWEWEYYPERLRISAILYRQVLNNEGEEMGGVDDLLISRTGEVEWIILSVGGFLGLDKKLVAVSFKPLKITDLGIVYNVTKQELGNLPALSDEVE